MKTKHYFFLSVSLILSLLLISCGGAAPTSAPTQPPAAQATQPQATQPAAPTQSPTSLPGYSVNLTVNGTDAIYLAGRDDVTIPPLNTDTTGFLLIRCGNEAVLETFPAGLAISPNATFTFNATGGISYQAIEGEPLIGPDSRPDSLSHTDSLAGISTYMGPTGALVGVFLGDANPKDQATPEPLDFSEGGVGVAFDRLTPVLGQVFFIGDGLVGAGTGAAQTFAAPDGATRLFLGIADAVLFFGPPGCYHDNVGSFQVQVTSSGPLRLLSAAAGQPAAGGEPATPLPATEATTTQPTAEAAAAQPSPSGATGQISNLISYRVHKVEHEGASGGPVKEEWTGDVILEPLAVHYKYTVDGRPMEIIVVGDSLWTKMMDMPWQETKQVDMGKSLSQMDKSNALNLQEGVPLEDNLTWLTGQSKLHIAEGSMTPAGEETANGIPCKKYTIDSTYFYTATFPAPLNTTGTATFQDKGEIWVANQSGWPSFVVRAQLTEVTTTNTPGGSKTETFYIEQNVTDINSPDIKIEPPQ